MDGDGRVHPNEIGVAVKYGVDTLGWTIGSYAKKIAPQSVAQRVAGVTAVENDRYVQLPRESTRTAAAAMLLDAWVGPREASGTRHARLCLKANDGMGR